MNYTKGEWKYHTVTGEIQSVLLGDNGFIKICDITPQDSLGRMEANAHLIAAAPEMYRALEILMMDLKGNNATMSRAMGEIITKALAKTKGEDNENQNT